MQACDRCHARKTRCDRRIPQCSACEKAGAACLHADKLRQRNIPRGYIDNMENLVAQLREENQSLRKKLEQQKEKEQRQEMTTSTSVSPSVTTMAAVGETRVHTSEETTPASTSSANGSTRATDPFTLEVGYLTLTATGEARYLGPSSGIDLASIISTVVSAQSGLANMVGGDPGGNTGSAVASSRLHIPSDFRSLFPTVAHAMPYIESYFQHTHHTFPLVHRPSFLSLTDRIFSEPSYYETHTLDAFIFDMVVSIGSSNKNLFDDSASSIASKCFAMGQAKIKTVIQMGGIASLRAILMICHHGIFSSLCDTSASIWHLVGIGARLSIELGLHLKQRRATETPPQGSSDENIVTFEEEMRRRTFWCLYNLDRVVSFTLGRPVAIRDEEMNTPLPSVLDDSCFGPDRPIVVEPKSPRKEVTTKKKTSPFLHVIQIRKTSGQILGLFYNAQHVHDVTMEEKRRARRAFELRLQEWHRATADLGLTDDDNLPYGSSYTSPEWYTAVYNNAMLLLYRPSPYMPHPTRAADSDDDMPDLLKLFNAGKTSILSYAELHRKRRLNYSWITMHGIFISGLAFIYSVGRILQDPGMRDRVPDFLIVVDVTRACSNILAVICERWNVSRRSCELFNKLSNAVIQDALHATIRRDSVSSSTMAELQTTAGLGCIPAVIEHPPQTQPTSTSLSRPYDPSVSIDMSTTLPQPPDEMLVMDEFRQFSETLDTTSTQDQAYPSEMVFGFLQDWPFDLPYEPSPGTMDNTMDSSMAGSMENPMHGMNSQW
ncbi:hypothetical protein SEUCBS140593_010298 [Sporothrix eucalyptigena]|uniref:Zn(2)-C6 fungal-type domain-containing protein n=1 Tax=Sporothrix eucalyptigena TaxID=1812306 RepID=A0ABP0D2K4_9PEZI